MKRIVISLLLLLMIGAEVQAQRGSSCPEDLIPAYDQKKKMWGYTNLFGMWVVPAFYTNVTPYVDNKAIVQNGLLYGVIDCEGNVIIPCQYQALSNFRYGHVWAKKNDLWGLLDSKGKVLMDFQFSEINPIKLTELSWLKKGELWGLFSEEKGQWICRPLYNVAQTMSDKASMVGIGDKYGVLNHVNCNYLIPLEISKVRKLSPQVITYRQNGKWGVFNSSGKIIIPAQYDSIGPKLDQYYLIVQNNSKYGIIEWNGEAVTPVKYEEIHDYKGGYFRIKENGVYGYMSKLGSVYIKPQYAQAGDFEMGEAIVQKNGQYGIIDAKNSFRLTPAYSQIKLSGDNKYYDITLSDAKHALVKLPYLKQDVTKVVTFQDVKAEDTITCIRVQQDTKWGYYNLTTQQYLFEKRYDQTLPFVSGFAVVADAGAFGVINTQGIALIPIKYKDITYVKWGNKLVFYVKGANGWGVLENTGKQVLPEEYEVIAWTPASYLKLKKGGKYAIYKADGTPVTEFIYDHLYNQEEDKGYPDFPSLAVKKGKYLLVDVKGVETPIAKATEVIWAGNNLYRVNYGKVYGWVSSSGKAFENRYTDARLYKESLAAVQKDGKWGYVTPTDQFLIQPLYEEADDFRDKLAIVKLNGKYGVINPRGKLVIPTEYDQFQIGKNGERLLFKDGVSKVLQKDGSLK